MENLMRNHVAAVTWLAFACLSMATPSVMAQESAWQNSYALETAGKYAEALQSLETVPLNGADAELRGLRTGWLYYRLGKWDESIFAYKKAIERNPRSMDARLGEVLSLLSARRWREAENGATEALKLQPNNYIALLRLAVAQEGQSDWNGLLRTSQTMTQYYPTEYLAYLYLARANAWLGKRTDAVAAYSAVLSRYPGYLEAKAYLEKR